MPSGWRQTELGNVLTLQRGFDLPIQERREGDVPVVSSSGITGTHSKAMVGAPGVVTGRYGTIGQTFLLTQAFWPLNTTLFVKDFKGNDARFVYYLLKTIDFASCSDKSSVPGVNRNHLHLLRVSVPESTSEQRAIAHILGTLDDKIELNRRMNEMLEEMARAIFKSWFVDFDPVRAKAEGRQPYGMGAETAAFFPDSFEDSPLGKIPKGWKLASLKEHLDSVRGLSYTGAGLSSTGVPLHNLDSVLEGGGYKHEGIKYYSGKYEDRHVVKPDDLIIANTEQGFDFLLIGYPAVIPSCFGERGIFSHHLYRVRPKPQSPVTNTFLYSLFMSHTMRSQIIACTNGTTVNMLAPDGLQRPQFALPPKKLIEAFDRIASPVRLWVELNHNESRTLVAARHALLPKLISGEIRTSTVTPAADSAPLAMKKDRTGKHQATDEFKEAVLISALVGALATAQFPLGRKRYNKLIYLIHRKAAQQQQIGGRFMKKAAGPYSPWMRYQGPEGIAMKNGYLKHLNGSKGSGFVSGNNIRQIDRYISRYGFTDPLNWVVNAFRYRTNDDLELLTTVDFAALDLLASGKPITVASLRELIASEPNWAPKLERALFSEEKIATALKELDQYFGLKQA